MLMGTEICKASLEDSQRAPQGDLENVPKKDILYYINEEPNKPELHHGLPIPGTEFYEMVHLFCNPSRRQPKTKREAIDRDRRVHGRCRRLTEKLRSNLYIDQIEKLVNLRLAEHNHEEILRIIKENLLQPFSQKKLEAIEQYHTLVEDILTGNKTLEDDELLRQLLEILDTIFLPEPSRISQLWSLTSILSSRSIPPSNGWSQFTKDIGYQKVMVV